MTSFSTSRVNEMLGVQIGVVQAAARNLRTGDLEQLEGDVRHLEEAIIQLKRIIEGLPHHHLA